MLDDRLVHMDCMYIENGALRSSEAPPTIILHIPPSRSFAGLTEIKPASETQPRRTGYVQFQKVVAHCHQKFKSSPQINSSWWVSWERSAFTTHKHELVQTSMYSQAMNVAERCFVPLRTTFTVPRAWLIRPISHDDAARMFAKFAGHIWQLPSSETTTQRFWCAPDRNPYSPNESRWRQWTLPTEGTVLSIRFASSTVAHNKLPRLTSRFKCGCF